VNGRVNCRNAVNVLQHCQARLLSSGGQKSLSSPDKANPDIPKGGSSQSSNTTRNILIGVGAAAVVAGIYYVSSVKYMSTFCVTSCECFDIFYSKIVVTFVIVAGPFCSCHIATCV